MPSRRMGRHRAGTRFGRISWKVGESGHAFRAEGFSGCETPAIENPTRGHDAPEPAFGLQNKRSVIAWKGLIETVHGWPGEDIVRSDPRGWSARAFHGCPAE